jgi:uncharacterized membrane-anchored protein YhcB (DUF1043 family)
LETTKNKKLISPPDEILIALHNDEWEQKQKKNFFLESSESCVERNKDKSCCHFNWSDKIINNLSKSLQKKYY